jgi:hypothetical protein
MCANNVNQRSVIKQSGIPVHLWSSDIRTEISGVLSTHRNATVSKGKGSALNRERADSRYR